MKAEDKELDLAPYIDHSLLNPTATIEQIEQVCQEADHYHFPVVCVYPSVVKLARELVQGKKIKIGTVIGFPTGSHTRATKLYEALEARENGAQELDLMINLTWVKTGQSEEIYQEIAQICEETGLTVKAILETNLLTNTEKRLVAEICMDAGVAFLKTNTGWFGGVTVADVKMLQEITKGRVGIKASGGIKTAEQAIELIKAGATRLGTSSGVKILQARTL